MILPLFISQCLLAAISITEVGLVSSMVGFLHVQKDGVKTYQVNWPNDTISIKTLPAHLWLDQGHTTNGAAGYGFVLSLLGLFIAFKHQKGKNTSRNLLILTILLTLSTLLTLAALIFTFVVTNQTSGQTIESSLAIAGDNYPADWWTPENWYKALLNIPLADQSVIGDFKYHIHLMEAWRWMLIPLFLADVFALGMAALALLGARKTATDLNVHRARKAERYVDTA